MFTLLLLSMAAAAGAPATDKIVTVDDTPSIHLNLAGYDFAKEKDIRSLKLNIRKAARSVCVRGRTTEMYQVTVACVKSAVADGNRQLDHLVARQGLGSTVAASISITTPVN